MQAITGNTYPVKDQIKALGGKWDANAKVWLVPDEKVEEAKTLVASGASGTASSAPKRFVHYKCQVCGVKADRYIKIYKSGECRDCYEERKMGY